MVWLLTPDLFVSVVCARENAGRGKIDSTKLMIRARKREHLDTLKKRCPQFTNVPTLETLGDYKYRIIVDKAEFAAAVVEIISNIDYENFKDAAAARGKDNKEYVDALHKVWWDLKVLQRNC